MLAHHFRSTALLLAFPIQLLALTRSASAQTYTIDWFSIDAGGGVSTGGSFTLHGTIGQWDAGVISTSAGLILAGGFEPGVPTGLPCRADFNNDTRVNSQDFFDFLAAFFANLRSADFNNDAIVNSQDFFDFLAAFFAGC